MRQVRLAGERRAEVNVTEGGRRRRKRGGGRGRVEEEGGRRKWVGGGKEARHDHLHRASPPPSTPPRNVMVVVGSLRRSMCSQKHLLACMCLHVSRQKASLDMYRDRSAKSIYAASSHLSRHLSCYHLCRLLASKLLPPMPPPPASPRSILLLTVFLPSQPPFLQAFLYMLGNINTD
jgi:hypothetical protein